MSKDVLIIYPQSTHPVRAGSQVRINHLIRHLYEDLGWNVDYFAPQGMLRPESWGPNMEYLRAIYIPRDCSVRAAPVRGPIFRLTHLKDALKGTVVMGLYMDIKAMVRQMLKRLVIHPKQPKKNFELLSHRRPKLQENAPLSNHPSPVSARRTGYVRRATWKPAESVGSRPATLTAIGDCACLRSVAMTWTAVSARTVWEGLA